MCASLLFQVSSPVKNIIKKKNELKAKLSSRRLGPLPSLPVPSGLQQFSQRSGVGGRFFRSSSASRASAVEGSRQPAPCLPLGLFQFPHGNSLCCACIGCTRVSHCLMKAFFGKRKAPLIKHYKRKLPTMVIMTRKRDPRAVRPYTGGQV